MATPSHVLFVCTGNTCRSPMAEGLFRAACKDVDVSSAGVAAMSGQRASSQTIKALTKRGVSLTDFHSRQVDDTIMETATMVVTMTSSHADVLRDCYPERSKDIYLLCDLIDPSENVQGADVPDPFGMSQPAYEEVAKVIDSAIAGIIGKAKS